VEEEEKMRTKLWAMLSAVLLLAGGCGSDEGEGPLGIAAFNVSPGSVAFQGSILISWEATASRNLRLEACTGFVDDPGNTYWCPGGNVRQLAVEDPQARIGSLVTNLVATTRFQLTAFGADAAQFVVSDWIEITVQTTPATGPRVVEFRASPRMVLAGETSTLFVDVRNATQVVFCDATAEPANAGGWDDCTTADAVDGTVQAQRDVSPTLTRLYGLKTADDQILAYAQLLVRSGMSAVPYISEFSADPLAVDEGGNVTLTWSVSDAEMPLTISPAVTGFTGTTAAGTVTFAPPFFGIGAARESSTVYTMTASNGDYADTAQVLITVRGAPQVVSFTAMPTTVESGGAVTLTWDTTRADSVTITAVPPDATLATTFAVDGTTTAHPTAATTYTLTATGATAAPTTATASVAVGSGAAIASFAAGGSPVTLTWDTTNATTVAITAVPADASLPGTFAVDGTTPVTPTVTTTYTITATGAIGGPTTATAGVTVIGVGDLVVTEIMFDPAGVADTNGEWFEVRNISTQTVTLAGFTLGDGTATHAVTGAASVAAGDWFVFGIDSNTATNGGAAVDYQYAGLAFPNTASLAASLRFDGVVIDTTTLTIPGGWVEGNAIVLNPSFTTAAGNDIQANWCTARTVDSYGTSGNHGTPGALNVCP
jgi:hypothetical protein